MTSDHDGRFYGNYRCTILKVAAFEPLARGRVKKIIFSQTNQTRTLQV